MALQHKDAHAVVGISGIGATYYFAPAAPSGYMLAVLGGSDYAFPFERSITTKKGGALMLGGGYEFDKHVMLEVTLLATSAADPGNSNDKIQSSALQFTLNYMFY